MRRPIGIVNALPLLLSANAFAQGVITTVAGTDLSFKGDGKPAIQAGLGTLMGVATDAVGNIYFCDGWTASPSSGLANNMVMKVAADGTLHVIAGNGIPGHSGDGGPATEASLSSPGWITVDAAGNVYFTEQLGSAGYLRKVTSAGIISTIGGGGTATPASGLQATTVRFDQLGGVLVDASGTIYLADPTHDQIFKISSNGTLSLFAGTGQRGSTGDGGPATAAQLQSPGGMAFGAGGIVYVSDGTVVRSISTAGIINTRISGLRAPMGLSVDREGDIYVYDVGFSVVIEFFASGTSYANLTNPLSQTNNTSLDDGGPAVNATVGSQFQGSNGIALDPTGNLYIADGYHHRIRRIGIDGNINTVAGGGIYRYSGDGGPAITALLNVPNGVSAAGGSLYVTDGFNCVIRQVNAAGVINTVAGNGFCGYAEIFPGAPATSDALGGLGISSADPVGNVYIGNVNQILKVTPAGQLSLYAGQASGGSLADSIPATQAELSWAPELGVFADAAGNIYIPDTGNNRVVKVTQDGILHIVAGGSKAGFGGDGGMATAALLNSPGQVTADSAGNVYIQDGGNARIRKVTAGGIITTIAGNGQVGSAGDGGPATLAQLQLGWASGLAIGADGTVYIADTGSNRIRAVDPAGVIRTVANTAATPGYTGDGGISTGAQLSAPAGLSIDASGNLFIADSGNNRIRVILSSAPSLQPISATVALSSTSNGKAANVNFEFTTALNTGPTPVPGMPYTAQVSSDSAWLSVSPSAGATPGLITITADPTNLPPGPYSGTITITVPNANPSTSTVNVQFTVTAAIPASLAVGHNHLSFTYSTASVARTQTITVSNTGGGPIPFSVAVAAPAGQSASWLSVTPASAIATPDAPAVLTVTADPSNLLAGTYSANLVISSAAGSATVSVNMTISANPLIMLLSQTGLTFTAVQNGGAVPPQMFSVLSLGSGTLNWTSQTSVLGGVNNWLIATPTGGASTLAAPAIVSVSVNPSGLAPGVYYGLVTVIAPGAANTPQGVVAILQVLPPATDLAPVVQPATLSFAGSTGNSSPGSLSVQVYDPTGTGKSFRSNIVTASGGSWLVTLPDDAIIPANGPANVVVQPLVNNLAPGLYHGTLTFQFSDGRVSLVQVQFVVAGGATADGRAKDASESCVSTQLMPTLTTLGSGFSVPAGYPQGLEARVMDNCGNPQVDGTVFVQFNNGDAPVKLQSLGNGMWDGTWPVGATPASVTLTVLAQNPAAVKGQSVLNGGLTAGMPAPVIPSNGIVSTASFASGQPVAPGELISIFGTNLSGGQSPAGAVVLPTSLAGTEVAVGSQSGPSAGVFAALPLYYASGGLVNAVVPYEVSVNTNQQILLQWGSAYAPPVYVDVAAAAPGIFAITDLSGNLIGANNPPGAAQVIVIYCTGLGAVTPAVADGSGSQALAYAQNPVTVTIGGQSITNLVYAGLTPGVAGLYQINVAVPPGLTAGNNVAVSIAAANQASNQVVLSVK